jgi:hypothetical protein
MLLNESIQHISTLKDLSKYERFQQTIFRYVSPLIIIISLGANLLAYVVYSGKSLRYKPMTFYTKALILINSACSLLLIRKIASYGYSYQINLMSDYLCKLDGFPYFMTTVSSYLLLAISFDRMICISYPKRFAAFKRKNFQTFLVISIIIFNLIFYWPFLLYFRISQNDSITYHSNTSTNESISPNEKVCLIDHTFLDEIHNWLDLLNSTIVPFVLMILFTSIMLVKVYQSKRRLSRTGSYKRRANKRETNLALVSISLNVIFLVFNLPIVLTSLIELDSDYEAISNTVTTNLFYSNFGSLFFINVLVNKLFKKELFKLIRLKSIKK